MRIRLDISDGQYEAIRCYLEEKGIEIRDDAEFLLSEQKGSSQHLLARDLNSSEKVVLDVKDILYIESYGHQLEIHTLDKTYLSSEPLYQIEAQLEPKDFIRINKSAIIAKKKIKEIKPALSMKFILIMENNYRLEVTRSYYNSFREAFQI